MINVAPGKHTVFARVLFNDGSAADSAPVDFFILSANPNLSFELPAIGSGKHVYGPDGGSWIFKSNSGDSGSGIVANGSAFGNPNAPHGTQAAFVQTYGTITQTLTGFAPGTNYTLTYSAAQRAGGNQHGGESWNVVVDGVVIKSNTPGSTSYTTYTANFTASLATHTLSFVGTDLAGGDNTVFLDNVRFTPALTSVVMPDIKTNTLPVTAVDVEGSEVTFLASFSSANPIQYQWQKIVGGVATDIMGATNTVLTLADLQLSDAGWYRLQASNALGVAVSAASSLAVSSVPAPVNDVITSFAAQTGRGSVATNFTPTWTLESGSLIQGKVPNSVGPGSFGRSPSLLTDGSFGWFTFWPNVGLSLTEVTCGSSAGQSVTYTLGNSPGGYSVSNIVVYGGWGDAGRDQQAYTVSYSTVTAPETFIALASVDYNPANPDAVQSATRSTLQSSTGGLLATNVVALKFDFTTPAPENGYCGYSEISVFGMPTPVTATTPTTLVMESSAEAFDLSWPSDHTGWRLQMQTNDLASGLSTNWVDIAGSNNTNRMSIPRNSLNGSVFFRLIYP
jgi:hypothetical protein